MTNCVKCGAELIGSRKFCAACGAPTDPSSLKRDASVAGPPSSPAPAAAQQSPPVPQINVPSTAYGPPLAPGQIAAPVNPFAATASPSSRAGGSPYGPPPPATSANPPSGTPGALPGPLDGTQPAPPVSPLAVSNALSQRGAFQQAAGDKLAPSAPGSSPTGTSPPPAPAAPKKTTGTQLMPSMQNPGASGPPGSMAAAAPQAKPPPARTQMMDPSSFVRPTPSTPAAPLRPSAPNQPVAQPVPPSVAHQPPSAHQPPPPAGQWGWSAPQPQGFGYAPGARVNVTWSNGQRYPATVSQVSGTQCLVVFPDGQQHWVEMQYLTPA